MTNTRLIDYLQNQGEIDKLLADQLRVKLAQSSLTEEQLLLQDGAVDEMTIAQAKSVMFNIPFVDIAQVQIPDALLSSVNADILKKFKSIPFEQQDSVVKVAMEDPFDIQAIQSLERQYPVGTRISVYIATKSAIRDVLERKVGEGITSEVSKALEDVDQPVTNLDESETSDLGDVSLQNAPVARIVNSIFQFAVKAGASDIHVEPMETKLRVRFRVHGILSEKLALPKHLTSAVISRIKIMSNLKIDEKRIPQDGRIPLKSGDHKIDIRVSTLPTVYGEKVVMRLLESGSSVPPLESSGLRKTGFQVYLEAIRATNGIILITGPTGSGKTRTLAGTLARLNDPKVNIITLENPVEIRVPGVNQVQINPDIGLTFANGLRAILRQDPNIVMVGEIRDRETAQLAVEASLTGHLVLATLHTNSAATAIPRLLDMGVEPYLLASTLRLVVAQRLPRRICNYCRKAYKASPQELEDINRVMSTIPNFDPKQYLTNLCLEDEKKKANPVISGAMDTKPDVKSVSEGIIGQLDKAKIIKINDDVPTEKEIAQKTSAEIVSPLNHSNPADQVAGATVASASSIPLSVASQDSVVSTSVATEDSSNNMYEVPYGTTFVCPDDGVYLYKGSGCDRCNGTGYSGRIGVFEVLPVTDKMGRMMMDQALSSEIEDEAIKTGMILIKQDGYLKALEGLTTLEEIMRVSKD